MIERQLHIPLNQAQLSAASDEESWEFEGYATIWGNKNAYDFSIMKGAYTKCLSEGQAPKMFFNHDTEKDVPIGKWLSLEEDDIGLRVKGKLTKGVLKANDVYYSLKAGTLDGLSVSIAFADFEDLNGEPVVREVLGLREISVCTYPADNKARITKCLSVDELDTKIEGIQSVRELESLFRDLGLSKRQSGWLVAKAKTAIASATRCDNEAEVNERLRCDLERLNQALTSIS